MNRYICIWFMACVCASASSDSPSGPDSVVREQLREVQNQHTASLKSVFTGFWDRDFRKYELHAVIQGLINQIDNEEMLKFLQNRGVQLTPEKIVTSDNLIAYLQYKKLGTSAAYAWLDLLKGNPYFVKAVLDWQAIRQERGFEFVPTYYLLFNAKLETKKDREVWADLFKATFKTLTERDTDKKSLMLMCSFPRIPSDLKEIDPPVVERLAFLAEEFKKQEDISKPYPQALLLALFEVNVAAKRFGEATVYAKRLSPPTSGLHLSFVAQFLAGDLDAAEATLSQLEKLAPKDKKTLDACRQIIRQVREKKQKQEPNSPPETTPQPVP